MESAIGYLQLAEEANGPIVRPVDFGYIWGAALDELDLQRPDATIVNLETSITHSEDYEPKGINYRMSPQNAQCLRAAEIDCCVLGNNHVGDWGRAGLLDTLAALESLSIKTVGAGRDFADAIKPAILDLPDGRLIVVSYASPSSGVPDAWAAGPDRPGVNLLPRLDEEAVESIAQCVAPFRHPGDIVVVSIHWGPNWGYDITGAERWFAQALIDRAGVSIVHGHSSHHAKAIAVYRERLILFGCGDFVNDYEGIQGFEEYRGDLALMYFVTVDPTSGALVEVGITPLQVRRFRLIRPSPEDVDWLQRRLDEQARSFETSVISAPGGRLALSWPRVGP
jgi:poly-gamma-glutamate synthesis protein (capsule biosynthesis protein)